MGFILGRASPLLSTDPPILEGAETAKSVTGTAELGTWKLCQWFASMAQKCGVWEIRFISASRSSVVTRCFAGICTL